MRFTHSNSQTSASSPLFYFYLRNTFIFLGYFGLGLLFSRIAASEYIKTPLISLPTVFDDVFDITTKWNNVFSDLFARIPSFLCSALIQALPLVMLFFLGLRDYDYFSLSRFWNLIFCGIHGIGFDRFLWYLHAESTNSTATVGMKIGFVFLSIVCIAVMVLQFYHLLQVNRICARGLSIPCLNRTKFRFPHKNSPDSKLFKEELGGYFRSLLIYYFMATGADMLLMLLTFCFRSITQPH